MLQCTIARQTCNILSILLQLDARGAGARPRLRAGATGVSSPALDTRDISQ